MNKTAFFKLSYGMYLVCSGNDVKKNGQIANSVFQIANDPPLIAASINKDNFTHAVIKEFGVFSVSVLDENTPMDFIGKFGFKSGRDINKFDGIEIEYGVLRTPLIYDNSVAFFEAELISETDAETHTIFIGKIVDAKVIGNGKPMTYSYYHQVKNGNAPKSAPVPHDVVDNKGGNMKKYKCTVCGYIYDSSKGDPDGGIAPGTAFEDIPDDWVCPICGVGKDQFEEA